MLSICVAVKNRSRIQVGDRELHLFPNCVRSIVESVNDSSECELVVADFHSDDWPLDDWVQKEAAPLAVSVVRLEGPFSRGRGLNAAADHASGDNLFFIDADAILSQELLCAGVGHLDCGKTYFPVLFSFDSPDHSSGNWLHSGYGHCMIRRETFEQAGRWPEFNSYGQEDEDFFALVSDISETVREPVSGFSHQWHPNSLEWKNQYGSEAPRLGREGERMRLACEVLSRLIPENATFILVDESQFCINHPPLERAIPFLERDGVYWGLPVDDAAAIEELARLREQGAGFIVFAWMSRWWLDYYKDFHAYLQDKYHPVLNSNDLLLFDMRASVQTLPKLAVFSTR